MPWRDHSIIEVAKCGPRGNSGTDELLMLAVREGEITKLGILFDRYQCENRSLFFKASYLHRF